MKITNINHGKIKGTADSRSVTREEELRGRTGRPESGGRSAAELSKLGRLVARARVAAQGVDEVRADAVARAKERVASGYYDSEEVRDRLAGKLAERLKSLINR